MRFYRLDLGDVVRSQDWPKLVALVEWMPADAAWRVSKQRVDKAMQTRRRLVGLAQKRTE